MQQSIENLNKKKPVFDLSSLNKRPPGLPALDFSNLKHVREADWYTQCKKLEDEIIPNLRAKVEQSEEEIDILQMRNQELSQKLMVIGESNIKLRTQLNQINDIKKNEEIQMQDKILQLIESDQESAPEEVEEDESEEDQPYADQVFEEVSNIVEKKQEVVSAKRVSKVRNIQSQSVEMLDKNVKAAYEDLGSEQKNNRTSISNRSSSFKKKVNLSIDTEEINRES